MDIKQSQKLSQKLTLTPLMRQSLHILGLPIIELKEYLNNQVEENPVLKYEDRPNQDFLSSEKIDRLIAREKGTTEDYLGQSHQELEKKRNYKESLITKDACLEEHLLKQLRMSGLNKKQLKIGELILTNLDINGYLSITEEEIIISINKNASDKDKITKKDIQDTLLYI